MLLLAASLWLGLAVAHFQLLFPPSIGFSDENEDKAPCGGFAPDKAKDKFDFHVGGEAMAMRLTHQQGNWLFRATTDEKANGGWTQLFPIVMQSGLGDFCEPAVSVPAEFAGKKGVVSVVSSATDGLLYQCVAVNFIEGSASNRPSQCRNASSVQASFTSDDQLSALVGTGASSPSSTRTSAASATSSSGAAQALSWNKAAVAAAAMLGLMA
ncbi:expression library immunization antigen 1 [Ophiocordyceps camponoti-floridani]|uniref:Expression library immunization antigen 1 n=1 Tax=Ophiocordyceps camponoti-floridani TaxID=2030778 RepID=A0A8H4VAA8_9HYPO|nr:expression library immunization antigen 1 [Ophiocordyceps camponoti-floridani]